MTKKVEVDKTVGLSDLQKEKLKLETDRAALGERFQALTTEREKTQQQLMMIAGALQALEHLVNIADPEVSLEEEVEADLGITKE